MLLGCEMTLVEVSEKWAICSLYHVISILRVVSDAQRWLLRTVNCDVNKRIKATWCHYIKKNSETQSCYLNCKAFYATSLNMFSFMSRNDYIKHLPFRPEVMNCTASKQMLDELRKHFKRLIAHYLSFRNISKTHWKKLIAWACLMRFELTGYDY